MAAAEVKGNIWKMYLVSFLRNLTFFGAIAVPFFLEWGRINYAQIFLLQSWFMIWIFLLEVPTGVVADKYGRKLSVALGTLMAGIGAVVYVSMPNFLVFLLGEFIMAVGASLQSGADRALLFDTLKRLKKAKEAKHIFARFEAADTAGLVVALPAGSVIASLMLLPYPNSLAVPMLLTSIPMVAACVASLTMKEPKRATPQEKYLSVAKGGIHYLLRNRKLRSLAIDWALIHSTGFFIFWFYQSLLGQIGVDIALYGFVGAAINILGALLLLKTRVLEKTLGIKQLMLLTAAVPGIFWIAMGLYATLAVALIGIFVVSAMTLLRRPLFDHYMNFHIRSRDRATVLSSISMLQRIVMIVLYPIIGFLSDISLQNTFLVLGVFTLIFAFLFRAQESALKVK